MYVPSSQETYGEDPWLSGFLGKAYVTALQGGGSYCRAVVSLSVAMRRWVGLLPYYRVLVGVATVRWVGYCCVMGVATVRWVGYCCVMGVATVRWVGTAVLQTCNGRGYSEVGRLLLYCRVGLRLVCWINFRDISVRE